MFSVISHKKRAKNLAAEIWKSHSVPISTKTQLMKALVWPVTTYGCESWTPGKNEAARRLDAFQLKVLRKFSTLWSHHEETRELPGERDNAVSEQCQVHAGEKDHARPGWTT